MVKNVKKYAGYLALYTLIFVLIGCLVMRYFYGMGRTLIYAGDGWTQHFKALVYYSRWLRSIVGNFLSTGKLSIPTFNFSLGYGSDLYTTLHYYVIGDPLTLFSAFVPARYMEHFYGLLIVIRFYLSGITFSCYCMSKKRYSKAAVLAGAFTYAFCGFALYGGVKHPFFMNPMIYFPLILLGVDRIFENKKPWLFIWAVALSAASNLYFFYMIVLLTVLYVAGKYLLTKKRTWKESLCFVLKLGGYGLTGLMIAGVIVLPVLLLFLQTSRTGNGYAVPLHYGMAYYWKFVSTFVTEEGLDNWNCRGYSALTVLAVFLLFIRGKEKRRLQAAFLAATGILLVPFAGYVLNCFSYASGRWVFGYSMLTAYILVDSWESFLELSEKKVFLLAVCSVLFHVFCVCTNGNRRVPLTLVLILNLAACAVLLLRRKGGRFREKTAAGTVLLLLTLFSVGSNIYFKYAPGQDNYAARFVPRAIADKYTKDPQAEAVQKVSDTEEFYRYSGNDLDHNSTLLSGLSNTQFYWSLSNGLKDVFWRQLEIMERRTLYNYRGLDSRAALNALAGVRYFVERKGWREGLVPYGFKKIGDLDGQYTVYKNENVLPLGYTYSHVLSQEDFDEMNSVDRQNALLEGVLLSELPEGFDYVKPEPDSTEPAWDTVFRSRAITREGKAFVTTAQEKAAIIEFEGMENCETYLRIEGLKYRGVTEYKLYNKNKKIDPLNRFTPKKWKKLSQQEQQYLKRKAFFQEEMTEHRISVISEGCRKRISYKTPHNTGYSGGHNYLVNLGYSRKGMSYVKLRFPAIGRYRFDKIEIICQPVKDFSKKTDALREEVLENVDLHNDNIAFATSEVTGEIKVSAPKILCLSIPYSSGWTAYVDGEEQEILPANIMFMALALEAGEHSIRLEYRTPGMKEGAMLTVLGLLCFAVLRVSSYCPRSKQ